VVAQGPWYGPAAFPAARVVAAQQTRESEFLLPPSEIPFLKHLCRGVKTTSPWKSRKAGVRALRYIFLPPHASLRVNDCQFALGFESANLFA
jgi:hypothetical protein